jgi:anti-sigma factor RsiW
MTEHFEIASYVLGLLDPAEMSRFEEHLAGCDECAGQLESLLPVVNQLADVEPGELFNVTGPSAFGPPAQSSAPRPLVTPAPLDPPAAPPRRSQLRSAEFPNPGYREESPVAGLPNNRPETNRPSVSRPAANRSASDRLLATGPATGESRTIEPLGQRAEPTRRIALSRPPSRRPESPGPATRPARPPRRANRSLLIASAAAIFGLVAGAGTVAVGPWFKPDSTSETAITSSANRLTASDPRTGVHADVALESKAWGTLVSFGVTDIGGPRKCRLVAVLSDGKTETLSSWTVPKAGYDQQTSPQELSLEAATALRRKDIAALKVEQIGDNGAGTTLVTIPT